MYLLATIFHNMIWLETALECHTIDAWTGFAVAVAWIAMIVYSVGGRFGGETREGEEGEGGEGEGGEDGAGAPGAAAAAAPGAGVGGGGGGPGAAQQAAAQQAAGAAFCPEITSADANSGTASGRGRTN